MSNNTINSDDIMVKWLKKSEQIIEILKRFWKIQIKIISKFEYFDLRFKLRAIRKPHLTATNNKRMRLLKT